MESRRGVAVFVLAGALAMCPGLARAVATTIEVEQAGKPLPGARIQIVDETGGVAAEGETDDRGRLTVDLAAGHHYRARTADGAHESPPFFAGDDVEFALPGPAPQVAIPGWELQVSFFAGYERQSTDASARGDAEVEELIEVPLGPFPDSPTDFVPVLMQVPVDESGDDPLERAIAGGEIQLVGPPCDCVPFHPRPLVFAGVPNFGDIRDRILDEPIGTAGDLRVTANRRAFDIGVGGLFPLDCGFDIETGLFYEYQRIRFEGELPGGLDVDDTARVHALGLRLGGGRTFYRGDSFDLGFFGRVEGVIPLSGDDESVVLRGGNNDLRFDLDAGFDFRATAGIRVGFALPF